MTVECICFGSIGAVSSCSEIQWKCFNEALKEKFEAGEITKNVPWEKEAYIKSLVSTGGRKRLNEHFGANGVESSEALIESIYNRKTELFVDIINKGGLTLRPGVHDLLTAAKDMGIKTAFCTTTDHRVADAIATQFGLKDLFDLCLSDQDLPKFGNKNKPEPDAYLYVVKTLFGQEDAVQKVIAFEDTQVSLASPVSANIKSIAVPNAWAVDHDFSGAVKKIGEVSDLGADGKNVIEVLSEICVMAKCN